MASADLVHLLLWAEFFGAGSGSWLALRCLALVSGKSRRLSRPTISTIEVTEPHELPFPSVQICPLSPIKADRIDSDSNSAIQQQAVDDTGFRMLLEFEDALLQLESEFFDSMGEFFLNGRDGNLIDETDWDTKNLGLKDQTDRTDRTCRYRDRIGEIGMRFDQY